MSEVLLISDDLRHAERLARGLDDPHSCLIHDLYDAGVPAVRPSLVVSDVKDLTSDAFSRLRRCIDGIHGANLPHILLVHGHAARAEMHARLIGAEPVAATAALRLLQMRIKSQPAPPPLPPATVAARRHAGEAKRFLDEVFFSDAAMTPDLADTGSELVAQAILETGIADWVRAVQRFDDVTHQHILLVAGLSAAFACSLGFNATDRHHLAKAALLHDVGKTKIPAVILNKPGRLDPEELKVMRTHAALGHAMLLNSGFDAATLTVVRSHHEMLDGSGYPDGLRAAEIPDLVRLVTISDIYAALIERRPYKSPMSGTAALAIIDDMAGRLDPVLVRAFRPVADAFDTASLGATA
ncbi:HD-GYP domain-containing protein [Methylobacterium komagatae]